jgi:hypothetical protein
MEEDFEQGSSAIQKLTDSILALMNANKEAEQAALDRAKEDKEASERKKKEKEVDDKSKATKKELIEATKRLGSEFLKIGEAGIKFASTIGTSATRGIELEFRNRAAVVAQILKLDADRAVSLAQQQAAQQALTDTFISTREGFQLSADGTKAFAANLKGGFKSEFQLTNESLRALVTTGMATEAQFENFRKASGRASLSSGQFANIVNKNTLSFLLYGPKFAKAATDAERLGISLAGVQAAQEGLVTNLDGTIDTVAQLNQLGAQVDFGTLVRVAEQEGPDALMAYARATIPANLLQSTSTRALFKQLGISAEDFLKAGGQQKSAAESIEEQMTEAAKKTNNFGATLVAIGTRAFSLLTTTFGGVAIAGFAAAKALLAVARSGGLSSLGRSMGFVSPMGGLGRVGAMYRATGMLGTLGAAGVGIGGGAMLGNALGGTTTGSTIGSLIGTGLGAFFGPAGMMVGGALGGAVGGYLTKANDMFSAGYGKRMLVTPTGAFAMNNADDIIAGTNLFPKGSLNAGSNNSDLVLKVDSLITALSNATTTINVGGSTQTVPRMQLVGVYSRNEVR